MQGYYKKLMDLDVLQGKNKNQMEVETLLLRVLSYSVPKYKQILQSGINLFICKIFNLHHLKA